MNVDSLMRRLRPLDAERTVGPWHFEFRSSDTSQKWTITLLTANRTSEGLSYHAQAESEEGLWKPPKVKDHGSTTNREQALREIIVDIVNHETHQH